MLEASSSSSWELQIRNKNSDIIKSSCPLEDEVGKLKPFQVVKGGGGKTGSARSFLVYIPPQLCTSLLSPPSPLLERSQQQPRPENTLRIILAIHGFSGRPLQEIKKWHNASISLNSIILAPEGTLTEKGHNLGWNAIDCCGDPVTNEIDDVDFVTNGVVDVFLSALKKRSEERNLLVHRSNVIATGFSNGGFLSSLLGLLQGNNRPPWLVGIVPTGGYQYDVELYDGPSKPDPMPMMSHHGGRDSIVVPDGCCADSNCVLDIGINQKTCTSVFSAFEMWSHINGCSSTALDEEIVNDRRMGKVDKGIEPKFTCWKGKDCKEPTNFCLWNNEGHAWGFQFPGIEMAQTWMEEVFHRADIRSSELGDHGNVTKDALSIYHSQKGKATFSAAFALLAVFSLLFYMSTKMHWVLGHRKKRKSSEDGETDHIGLQKLVISNDH